MARGLILKVEYTDINDKHQNRVEVWQEGYTGEILVRDGLASPFVIEWGDSSGDDFLVIYGSTATLRFYQASAFEFRSFFDADAKKNLVKHYKDDILFWTGYGIANTWEEDPNDPCHEASLIACDGLGLLSDLDFTDSYGAEYTGRKTINQIIDILIKDKTGLSLDLYYALDWNNNLTLPYFSLYKDCESFTGMTCAEILEDVLFGCRVFQRHGAWFIVSYSNWSKDQFYLTVPSYVIDDYLSGDFAAGDFLTSVAGLTDTRLIIPTTSDFWFENTLNIQLLPAIKKMVIVEDFGYVSNIISNGDFSQGDLNWIVAADVTLVIPNFSDGKYFGELRNAKSFPANPLDMTKYIKWSEFSLKAGLEDLRIKFDYAVLGAEGQTSELYCKIMLENDDPLGQDYWAYYFWNEFGITEQLILLWSTTEGVLRLGASADQDGVITYNDASAKPYFFEKTGFRGFNFKIGTIPVNGTLHLYFYGPYSENPAIYWSCITNYSVEIFDDEGNDLPNSRDITIINSQLNNVIDDDIESVVSDFPSEIDNAALAYLCGLMDEDYNPTTGWKLSGATFYEFNEFRGRMLTSMKRTPRQNYQCRAADMVPDIKMVIVDTNNSNIKLLENGISYDDAMMTCEGQYTEILNADLETGQAGALTVTKIDNY